MQTNLKLDEKLIDEAVRLGRFKTKEQAVKTAVAEFIQRHQHRLILDLSGKIQFDTDWDYKKMRRGRS
ncbi:MAG TPA: type II toxin-antitoxin system VapB family antitoxin [Candidatus Cybelea sp.]|nr:type II toxin-antitoxin system VapB family antitoxin [Candidatus Cybelea sp.]